MTVPVPVALAVMVVSIWPLLTLIGLVPVAALAADQGSSPSWALIDRYGLPISVLIVFAWGVYKTIWPLLLQQIADRDKLLERQLEISQTRLDKVTGDFLHALEQRDTIMKNEFERLHERFDRDRDRAK